MNECNNIIRTYKKIIVTEENDYNMSACDQYEDIDLCNAIQSLHEELRAVTVLYYYEDMNQESIAKLLEVPKRNSEIEIGTCEGTTTETIKDGIGVQRMDNEKIFDEKLKKENKRRECYSATRVK